MNLLAKKPRCPDCGAANPVPYDNPQLLGSAGEHTVAEWNIEGRLGRGLILTDGSYRCPKCGKMTLRFSDTGLCFD
jgi:DNA-directed RNA polymerase subunit RPC12/RpoP